MSIELLIKEVLKKEKCIPRPLLSSTILLEIYHENPNWEYLDLYKKKGRLTMHGPYLSLIDQKVEQMILNGEVVVCSEGDLTTNKKDCEKCKEKDYMKEAKEATEIFLNLRY